MDLKFVLPTKVKRRRRDKIVIVDLYEIASDLYRELEGLDVIERINQIKQLGAIKVGKKNEITKIDYVMLQLYFHQIIKKNIQSKLEYTYNSGLKMRDFLSENTLDNKKELDKVSVCDAIQLLILAYNIGHFYNTFVASKAVVMLADKDYSFRNHIITSSKSPRFKKIADELLLQHNYQRLHLLNSLLVLERCDSSNRAVKISKELLYAYLEESSLSEDSKLHYVFTVFRKVRTMSFVAFDLQVAGIPFSLDVDNEKALLGFLDEYLAEYNNNESAEYIINAFTKLLNDSVYNDLSGTICMTQISKKMSKQLCVEEKYRDYFNDYWSDYHSVLNKSYPRKIDYEDYFLKLTFSEEYRELTEKLFYKLDKINNVRVGYYLRHVGKMTLVVSMSKKCERKTEVAFRILQTVSSYMQLMGVEPFDSNYILLVRYFLFYIVGGRIVNINPVVDKEKCVVCTRGKNQRINQLSKLDNKGTADDWHEVDAIIEFFKDDTKNDTTITVFGSTVVMDDNSKSFAEFDGIIIYPNRKKEQIVYIEAKNRKRKVGEAKKCMIDRFDKLEMDYDQEQIITIGHDAYYKGTI